MKFSDVFCLRVGHGIEKESRRGKTMKKISPSVHESRTDTENKSFWRSAFEELECAMVQVEYPACGGTTRCNSSNFSVSLCEILLCTGLFDQVLEERPYFGGHCMDRCPACLASSCVIRVRLNERIDPVVKSDFPYICLTR